MINKYRVHINRGDTRYSVNVVTYDAIAAINLAIKHLLENAGWPETMSMEARRYQLEVIKLEIVKDHVHVIS